MAFLAFLSQECPGFALRGSQVKIIQEPSQFYNELYKRTLLAKKRIVLSSLYLGTGEKEQKLVGALKENLERSVGSLKVKILLDYCRGNRMDQLGNSSATLLKPLVKNHQDSCSLSLYHTPALRGFWKRWIPPRYNETLGLQHCKVYVFDDSLIISGANLSQDYFTNRQDRYVLIEDAKKLADFYEAFISHISDFSFQMNEAGNFQLSPNCPSHPYENDYNEFVSQIKDKMSTFLEEQKEKHNLDSNYQLQNGENGDTWIFPTVQMGLFGIDQDYRVTNQILEKAPQGSVLKFGTGYFNLTEEYLHSILHKSEAKFHLLMAHPEANGFYQAKGPAGGIPHAYTLIANQFFDLIEKNDDSTRIMLHEYQRLNWTFHGKGIWIYLPEKCQTESWPVATLVGSPNFGHRSVEKDLESQIVIVTKNDELQKSLHLEQERLYERSSLVTEEMFKLPDRKVPQWVKFVVAAARNYF